MGTAEESPPYVQRATRDRLGRLYEVHAPAATRLAFLLTGDRELARDLAQDAFVRVAGRFATLRSTETFESYLRSTIYNLVRSHFRRLRVERRHLAKEGREPIVDQAPGSDLHHDMTVTLNELPVRQRAALVFRYYVDLTEQQTADAMGCSVAAVRSLTFRALTALRISIEEETKT